MKLAEKWKGNQDLPSGGENQEIDVPGFKTLVFRANQTSQKVNFYNPEENECLFKLKLYAMINSYGNPAIFNQVMVTMILKLVIR